ncbi:MAG: hypothetical protein IJX64_02285 [Clostridia bacterium]|nr:hypothetical protein [Clostridia bacterium]
MRNTEFLAVACAFALCLTAAPSEYRSTRLHDSTVQAFSFVPALSDTVPESDVLLVSTEHGGADYLSRIVFLGDSRTYGLKAFSMLDGGEETAQVWTPRSGTMSIWDMQLQKIVYPETDTEMTCAEAAALKQPEILVISLGFNGFEMVQKEYFVSEYLKLIESIQAASPNTKIVLQSMFPVCRSYTLISNDSIREGNKWIVEIAKRAEVYYLNTQEVLTDDAGYLIEDYSTDGCHLTPLGLDVELEYICTHMIGED